MQDVHTDTRREALNRLVKIRTRVSKRNYLKAKRTYEYGRMSLDIPKKFHESLKPFLEKELNIDVKLENSIAIISLSLVKTFRHAENTPDKTQSKPTETMVQERQTSDFV
jgi:hypothetical protein